MGSYERSGFTSGWLCAFLWWSVLLCSDVGSTFYCPRFWRVLFCGTLTDGEVGLGPSSSRPVAVSPPFWGWVCFGGLAGVVVHLRDAWRGFPRLVGLLAALLEVYLSISSSLFLCRVPRLLRLFSPGRRVVVSEAGLAVRVSLLATSLPFTMVFP